MRRHTLVPFVVTALTAMGLSVHSAAADSAHAREDTSMLFIVWHAHGNARRPGTTSRDMGVTRARSPEEAVKQFTDKQSTAQWVFHDDSRTNTYVRLENPISFVSDRIDYYAAQAGEPVTNGQGHIKFTVSTVRHEDFLGERVVSSKEVWADSAAAALERAVSQRERKGCSVSNHNRNRYSATLACRRHEGETRTISWHAVAQLTLLE